MLGLNPDPGRPHHNHGKEAAMSDRRVVVYSSPT
jgi:hypothetical protein